MSKKGSTAKKATAEKCCCRSEAHEIETDEYTKRVEVLEARKKPCSDVTSEEMSLMLECISGLYGLVFLLQKHTSDNGQLNEIGDMVKPMVDNLHHVYERISSRENGRFVPGLE